MFTQALLLVTLCATQGEAETFIGRRPSLITRKPGTSRERKIHNLSSLQPFVWSSVLDLRGGGDERGRNENYGSDDGRRDYNYDDRRRTNDYGYQDDRGYSRSSNYGYQDDGGRPSDSYRGYDNGRGRTGDYGYQDEGREGSYEEDRSQRDYYDDRGSRGSRSSNAISGIPSIVRHGNKRIGLMLLSFGAIVTFLGISFFFNKALLRFGNLLFIAGVPMTIGPGRTAGYFFQPKKSRATACLCLGIFLVFVGRPIFGMVLEFFGFLNLFGNMFPVAFAVLRQMPIVGSLFGGGSRRRSRSKPSNRSEDYYRDGGRDEDAEHYY